MLCMYVCVYVCIYVCVFFHPHLGRWSNDIRLLVLGFFNRQAETITGIGGLCWRGDCRSWFCAGGALQKYWVEGRSSWEPHQDVEARAYYFTRTFHMFVLSDFKMRSWRLLKPQQFSSIFFSSCGLCRSSTSTINIDHHIVIINKFVSYPLLIHC